MIILTFDTDYMRPDWMSAFMNRYPNLPKSTFFLHKDSLDWDSDFHEINEHPTIVDLHEFSLSTNLGHPIRGKGLRSHSCVSSHMLSVNWAKSGIKYQSQETRWGQTYKSPERTAWGIYEFPISYMDNQDLWIEKNWTHKHEKFSQSLIDLATQSSEIFLFDFHPLHIALNTKSVDDYALKKESLEFHMSKAWGEPTEFGEGVRDFFEKVLSSIEELGTKTSTCEELIDADQFFASSRY